MFGDRNIDAALAQAVMGWEIRWTVVRGYRGYQRTELRYRTGPRNFAILPVFTWKLNDAFMLVRHIVENGGDFRLEHTDGGWEAEVVTPEGGLGVASHQYAPMAICLATMEAYDVEVVEEE